jgi:hypothetical protein
MAISYRTRTQSNQWQDWVNLILAVWLFLSPWILGFAGGGAGAPAAGAAPAAATAGSADWNAWVLGVIIFIVTVSAISSLHLWQEWVNLLLGVWLFIAPWVLGFSGAANAAWDHWIVGVLVFAIAMCNLQTMRPETTASVEPGYAGNKPDIRR